jgi:CHAT domain-containing protein
MEVFSQKIEKSISKFDRKFERGAYKASLKSNSLVIKKINASKFSSPDTILSGLVWANQLKAAEATGKFSIMDSLLKISEIKIESLKMSAPKDYMRSLKIIAEAWGGYGNFQKEGEYIDKMASQYTLAGLNESILLSKIQVYKAQNLINRGFYNEALAILEKEMPYRKQRAEEAKTNSSLKKERKQRNSDLAKVYALRNLALLKRGDYAILALSLDADYEWVKKNVGSTSLEARDLLLVKAQLFETKKETHNATKTYLKAFHKSKAKFSEKKVLDILDKVVYSYNAENDRHRARKYIRKLESALSLEYGRKNPNYLRYDFVEFQSAYQFSKFSKAEKKLNKMFKSKYQFPQNHPFYAKMLYYSYDLNSKSSILDPAIDSLNKLVNLKKTLYGELAPEYHKTRLTLANFYAVYASKFADAQKIEDESWDKVVSPQLSPENLEYIHYLEQLAILYDLIDKYDLSIEQLNTAATTVEKYYGKENVDYASALQKLAEEYLKKGDFSKGEALINEAVALMTKVSGKENATDKAATFLTLAKLYTTMGKYEEAQTALRKAKRNAKKAKDSKASETASKSTDELADFYIKNGRYNDAENLLDRTLFLKEKKFGKQSKDIIITLNQMAALNLIKGNFTDAEKNINRSTALTQKIFGDSSIRYTECLKLREDLYKKMGEFLKSEESALQKLAIQKKQLGNNHIDLAATISNISLLKFQSTKNVEQSIKYLSDAIEIVKKNIGTDNPQYANQITNLATLYIEAKNFDKASQLLQEANTIWLKVMGSKNNVNTADINMLEGAIFYRQEKFSSAQAKFYEARKLYKSIFSKQHPGYVKASSKLAHTYFVNREYTKSLKIMDEILVTYLNYTKKYFPSLSFNEKAKYWSLIKDDFEFYNALCMKLIDKNPDLASKMYNNTIATKALLLSSSIKVRERILNSRDEQLINRYNEWIGKKEYLTGIISLSNETLKQMGVSVAALEKEINQLEKDLSESSELFATNADKRVYTWKDVKNSLENYEYAVEILRYRKFDTHFTDSSVYIALILSAVTDKRPEMVVMKNGKELEGKYLHYYRNAAKNLTEETYSYDNFWAPIKEKIVDSALVYLSADGVYNQVNIEAMLDDSSKYSIDRNDFLLVSNTKDLILSNIKERRQNANKAVLCGNPLFYVGQTSGNEQLAVSDRGANIAIKKVKKTDVIAKEIQRDFRSNDEISQLPGTEEEINNLYAYLNTKDWDIKKYVQKTAEEDSIKAIRQPKIFHIATHGFFKEDISKDELSGLTASESEFTQNPLLRSGLLLKGAGDVLKSSSILDINSEKGVLTAYEAMNMNLDNTELVVLSACETGLGEIQVGEGVFGLQRSFLVAGANTVIMSLFKVNDEVTQKLMTRFYERWLLTGDKRKAFSEAKKEIKKAYPQPIYWGSFVMSGI